LRKEVSLALFILFALLAGYVYLYPPPPTPVEEEAAKLFPLGLGEVQRLEARREDEFIVAEKKQGNWSLVKPKRLTSQGLDRISGFVKAVEDTVKIDSVGIVPKERWAEYGMDSPSAVIALSFPPPAEPIALMLGGFNPARTRIYARFEGSGEIFLVGSLLDFEVGQLFSLMASRAPR
jgi:hypothetical protein